MNLLLECLFNCFLAHFPCVLSEFCKFLCLYLKLVYSICMTLVLTGLIVMAFLCVGNWFFPLFLVLFLPSCQISLLYGFERHKSWLYCFSALFSSLHCFSFVCFICFHKRDLMRKDPARYILRNCTWISEPFYGIRILSVSAVKYENNFKKGAERMTSGKS